MVILGAVVGAIGVAGAVVGSVALAKVESTTPGAVSPAVTVTAAPKSAATTDTEVHAAAVETCAAAGTFRAAVGAVRQPYIDAVKAGIDSSSPEFVSAEGRYFGGAAVELAYLTTHINPVAPSHITDAVTELLRAATELFDTDVRSEAGAVSNQALAKLRDADGVVRSACDAHGASK